MYLVHFNAILMSFPNVCERNLVVSDIFLTYSSLFGMMIPMTVIGFRELKPETGIQELMVCQYR